MYFLRAAVYTLASLQGVHVGYIVSILELERDTLNRSYEQEKIDFASPFLHSWLHLGLAQYDVMTAGCSSYSALILQGPDESNPFSLRKCPEEHESPCLGGSRI